MVHVIFVKGRKKNYILQANIWRLECADTINQNTDAGIAQLCSESIFSLRQVGGEVVEHITLKVK